MERALSFGTVAEAYHRHRPGYPDELADLALGHADGPVVRALEVGAGTGKATAVFAGRGLEVVAVEPDPAMREVLEREVRDHGWAVEVVDAGFEDLDPDRTGPFDLVYAASAFHWTDPATRWDRAAALLRPGGVLAVLGCARDLADAALRDRVDAATSGRLEGGHRAPFTGGWTVDVIEAHPLLTDVVETTIERRATMRADDYLAGLATISAYVVLPGPERAELLAMLRTLLPDEVEVSEDVRVQLARRVA
jgi:SAM-dependent methyltransferase